VLQKVLHLEPKDVDSNLISHLQQMLEQKKYRQALEEIKKYQRSHPDIKLKAQEAEIWCLRGQWEFEKKDFKQAEQSLRRSLELAPVKEAFYWQIRCLLQLNQIDTAIKLAKDAFVTEKLSPEENIFYLKLLLLKGEISTVAQLIDQQPHKFSSTHLQWVKGVLNLKQGNTKDALALFQEINSPNTPGDAPAAWVIYTQQISDNFEAAAHSLANHFSKNQEMIIFHQLLAYQQAKTGKLITKSPELTSLDKTTQEAITTLQLWQEVKDENYCSAAQLLLKMERRTKQYPELASLRANLLILAGQQALNEEKTELAEMFWRTVIAEEPFHPQVAVNLLKVQRMNDYSHQERQQLLNRFLPWLEKEAKLHPEEWSEIRYKSTVAHLHCLIADNLMSMERRRAAVKELEKAERILPTFCEAIARRGLIAYIENDSRQAINLLTEALEKGSRFSEAYFALLECCQELNDKQAHNDVRRRFGKYFGDLEVETEVEVIPWKDALSAQNYSIFSCLAQTKDQPDPPLVACRIFADATKGVPNSGGKVSLNQAEATKQWDTLLQGLSENDQIPVLQAIAISIHRFAKREKGIAGLLTKYLQKLDSLSAEHPDAKIAYLVTLAVKENNSDKLAKPIAKYLSTIPQPGNALANIQIQARCFGLIQSLVPYLEKYLREEPQNPLLLLAKATTYSVTDPDYIQLKQQGFELARRLQDAQALRAFREEQTFLDNQAAKKFLRDPGKLANMDTSELDEFMEEMIREILGGRLSPSELERMIPEIKQKMLNEMPGFFEFDDDDDDDDDDDEIDFATLLGRTSSNSKKNKGRNRGGFQELL